jgi:hypothetical protein
MINKMKKPLLISLSVFLILIILILVFIYFKTKSVDEYLHITTISYRNGKNYDDGVSMVTYLYDVEKKTMQRSPNIPISVSYAISYNDVKNHRIFYTNSEVGENYDNLYVYDLKKNSSTRLTDGKFLFNDFLMIDGTLICNVAPRFKNCTRPAIFDQKDNTFKYLNYDDDDTWYFSLSYNKAANKLLALTCSDSEMRSLEVRAVTHIRPKTIYMMNPDFTEPEQVFYTKDFEIRVTRQLDQNRILMAVDDSMGASTSRKLKIFDMTTQELSELETPGLKDMQSFMTRENAEGIFIYGRSLDDHFSIFYYDLITSEISDIFADYEFPSDFCSIVDFTYSYDE